MNKLLPLLLCFLGFTKFVDAQTDNEFWFVAPEVTAGHADRPIYLRMAALGSQAIVTIDQPANAAFKRIIDTIPANSASTIDLTPFIDIIENKPADSILTYGIHIVSTGLITAYYEVLNGLNCDIFALKGRNALGTLFYTPFQNLWTNQSEGPPAYSAFEIVATQDSTVITITPTQNLSGNTIGANKHPADSTFTIVLNKGQTYSGAAAGVGGNYRARSAHPCGTKITSNKPIAVTVSDDSVIISGWDLMGDQLVPVTILGTEYIVMKGNLSGDGIFILGTQDSTDIFIDTNKVASARIGAGQTFDYTLINTSTYIHTTQSVYVIHASGYGGEIAEALLPSITCTGSTDVYFVRSNLPTLQLNIMTKTGHEGHFNLNGDSTLIPASAFKKVLGDTTWVAAQVSPNLPIGSNNHLSNSTGLFHMGLIMGNGSTASYGYFSSYSQLNIGPNVAVCPDSSSTLNAGAGYDSYLWNNGDTTQIIPVDTGRYWVTVSRFGCMASDTVTVYNYKVPKINLVDDTICSLTMKAVLDAGPSNNLYNWSNGVTTQTDTVSVGTYFLTVINKNNCPSSAKDSVHVRLLIPSINLNTVLGYKQDTTFCDSTFTRTLDAGPGEQSYLWSNGDTTESLTVSPGSYSVTFINPLGCPGASDTINIAVVKPTISINDTGICDPNGMVTLNAGVEKNYLWSNGDTTQIITVHPGSYTVKFINNLGCTGTSKDTIHVYLSPVVAGFKTAPSSVIALVPAQFIDSSHTGMGTIISWAWDFGDGNKSNKQNPLHTYSDTGKYKVTLVVTNSEGCIDTLAVPVEASHISITIFPNVFTPNGDGINDFLVFDYLQQYPGTILSIYNRWGNLIYQDNAYKNTWDGENNPAGVYYYILQINYPQGAETKHGMFTIIK